MEIYLIKKETREIKNSYNNVLKWDSDYVEYLNCGYRGKIYCDRQTEYFTNMKPEIKETGE